MSNASEEARRAFERDQQARMKEAHEFRTYQERMDYNGRIAHERRRLEEEERRKRNGR